MQRCVVRCISSRGHDETGCPLHQIRITAMPHAAKLATHTHTQTPESNHHACTLVAEGRSRPLCFCSGHLAASISRSSVGINGLASLGPRFW